MKTHLAAPRPSRVGPSSLRILVTALALLASDFSLVRAQTPTVPPFLSYQGKVTDATGAAIGSPTPVNKRIRFRIWKDATNSTLSDLVYSEEQVATIAVGEFSVLIGQGTGVTTGNGVIAGESAKGKPTVTIDAPGVFGGAPNEARYLGISIEDNSGNFTEISPRQQLVTAAYAFRAKYAEAVGYNGTNTMSVDSNGNMGIGATPSGNAKLDVAGAVTVSGAAATSGFIFNAGSAGLDGLFSPGNDQLSLKTNGTDRLYIDASGRVGVGVNTGLGSALEVNGNVASTGHVFRTTGGTDDGLFSPNDGILTLKTNNTERLRIDGTTGLTTVTGNAIVTGTLSATSHTFQGAGGSDDGLFWVSDNIIALKTANVERLRIDGSGNLSAGGGLTIGSVTGSGGTLSIAGSTTISNKLGVGVSIPTYPLHFPNSLGEKIVFWDDTAGAGGFGTYGLGIQGGLLTVHSSGNTSDIAFGYTNSSGTLTERMRIKGTGYVGIGTNNPQAPLDVRGHADMGFFLEGVLDAVSPRDIPNQFITLQEGIIAESRIRATAFDVVSDSRIKQISGKSSGKTDLETLMKIEITDYTFKDTITKSKRPQKKVIAQQVETVYPQAVGQTTDVIPDIYQKATQKDGWIALATDLKVGERVRVIGEAGAEVHEVLAVEAGRFRTDFKSSTEKVFVYGREVKDFRSVDYEAISMLNVSATQQIKRDNDAALTALRDENAGLRSRLEQLEAKDKARDERLAALERRMQAGATVMARPAPTTNSNGQ